jgi:hypothetical protein
MDQKRICFFTYADGDWRYMAQTMVNSMRVHGVTSDIVCFADKPILGASHTHYRNLTAEQKHLYFFKLDLLATFSHATEYDYVVWLDADNYFVRPLQDDFLAPMEFSPLHSQLGWSFCDFPDDTWWSIPNHEIVAKYRKYGVTSDQIYTSNGGYWIVERKFIPIMSDMVHYFRTVEPENITYIDELVIGWILHLVSGNLRLHLGNNSRSDYIIYEPEVWRLPIEHDLYVANNLYPGCGGYVKTNPSIVHLVHGKQAMLEAGKECLMSKKLLEQSCL